MTLYQEVVFVQGEDADGLIELFDNDVALGLAEMTEYDLFDEVEKPVTRDDMMAQFGEGSRSAENADQFAAYHWNHQWVHYFRKVDEV